MTFKRFLKTLACMVRNHEWDVDDTRAPTTRQCRRCLRLEVNLRPAGEQPEWAVKR